IRPEVRGEALPGVHVPQPDRACVALFSLFASDQDVTVGKEPDWALLRGGLPTVSRLGWQEPPDPGCPHSPEDQEEHKPTSAARQRFHRTFPPRYFGGIKGAIIVSREGIAWENPHRRRTISSPAC